TARYLRVNMNYNSANIGVHIVEFEAYGELASSLSKVFNTTNKTLLYPNPAKKGSTIAINARSFTEGDEILIEVNGLNGLILDNTVILDNTKTIKLNTENFDTGLNFITLTSKNKKNSCKVIIK
ncbi:T9SS type A sorting domain-containing protein, partial [Winogradskyella alexanderae]